MKDFLKLIRIHQWVKNLCVFLPLIFGGGLLSGPRVMAAVIVFFCFSLMASAIYIVNDLADLTSDRKHPVKKNRPVAAGRIPEWAAGAVSGAFASLSLILAARLLPATPEVWIIIGGYGVLNLCYTYLLKHLAIIDVSVIATGFVLRVLAGGAASGIEVSPWLAVMVFLLTLFIAFGKRRDDLQHSDKSGQSLRKSVRNYTVGFVDQAMSMLASAVIVAYVIYTLQPEVEARFHSHYVYLTTIFVIAGILRYMQITVVHRDSGQPSRLMLRDPFILICGILWLGSFIFIIYC